MDHLGRVEYLPEPEDARILSAIDPAAVGFQGAWRAEVTGWAPLEAAPVLSSRRLPTQTSVNSTRQSKALNSISRTWQK